MRLFKMIEEQLTIGDAIGHLRRFRPDAQVIAWGGFGTVERVISYRGHYDQPALLISKDAEITAGRLIEVLEDAVRPGLMFHGWKGGEYQMVLDSPLWITGETDGARGWGLIDIDHLRDDAVLVFSHEDMEEG